MDLAVLLTVILTGDQHAFALQVAPLPLVISSTMSLLRRPRTLSSLAAVSTYALLLLPGVLCVPTSTEHRPARRAGASPSPGCYCKLASSCPTVAYQYVCRRLPRVVPVDRFEQRRV